MVGSTASLINAQSKIMKKRLCPACKVASLFLMNEESERLSIYVDEHYVIHPKQEGASLIGFNSDTIFCYGCSWSGSVKSLILR